MHYRDLALSVVQLEPNEYHWVLMETSCSPTDEVLSYVPVDSSARGYARYSEALVAGAVAVRELQGLSTFGSAGGVTAGINSDAPTLPADL